MRIHGIEVLGRGVDPETRCAHYHGESDVIAIQSRCCRRWFPCHLCHAEQSDHDLAVWPVPEFETRAVLCGRCGYQLTIREYLGCGAACPDCRQPFNPGCAGHYHFYFEVAGSA